MSLSEYLMEHRGMLVMLAGLSIVLYADKSLERRMIIRMAVTIVMIFVYSITCHVETYLGNQIEFSVLRPILSAVNYSLITFLLVNIIMIVYPEQKKFVYIPAVLNSILCFTSIKTGIVFWFTDDNHFQRGPLGYLTYVIDLIYIIYLVFRLFNSKKIHREDYPFMLFLVITSIMCLCMPLFMEEVAAHWYNITIGITVTLYYIYLLQQNTKRDSLTNLLNRQSYYSDAEKYNNEITGFITMDMDGLKEINDTQGHIAGDTAIKTLADCFWRAREKKQRIYRIGGDEFVILCMGATSQQVLELVSRIKQEISETEYSCSIGYAMKKRSNSLDEIYKMADTMMYEEKQRYYESKGKQRRKG